MDTSSLEVTGLKGSLARIGNVIGQILQDHVEIISLEVREAKIRFIQALVLACCGVVFALLGVILAILAGIYALPPEYRVYGFAGAAALLLLAALVAGLLVRSHFTKAAMPFAQTLQELKKDLECFSAKN